MSEDPNIEILSEPLLTSNGGINPLCMAELAEAIEGMPEIHDRFAYDPEWSESKDRWTFRHDITGPLAMWAVRQSPVGIPKDLSVVLGYLDEALKTAFGWETAGMSELSLCDISRALHEILMNQGIKEFDAWNETRPDFIDLHALLRNVCFTIRDERRISAQGPQP